MEASEGNAFFASETSGWRFSRPVRLSLVGLVVVGAVAVAFWGGRRTWVSLAHARVRLDARSALEAPGVHERLPMAEFDRWRTRLRRGESWWLEVPAGRAEGLTTRGAVYRAFATYWLLPAVPADSPREATVVFRTPIAK